MIFQGYDSVMFGDVDGSGVGHFAHQIRFLERAEFLFMKAVHLEPTHWFLGQHLFPRVHVDVDYRAPLHFGDEMRYDVQVVRIGSTSYTLGIGVENLTTATTAMQANVVIVVMDPGTRQPVDVPQEIRGAFQPYLIAPGA